MAVKKKPTTVKDAQKKRKGAPKGKPKKAQPKHHDEDSDESTVMEPPKQQVRRSNRRTKGDENDPEDIDNAMESEMESDEESEEEVVAPENRANSGTIRVTLGDDPGALQAQLAESRNKIHQLEMVQEQRAGAHLLPRSDNTKKLIRDAVFVHLFHVCKFITENKDLDRAVEFVLKKADLQYKDQKESYILTWRQFTSTCLCDRRNYAQSQLRQAILDYCAAPLTIVELPTEPGKAPVSKQKEIPACVTPDLMLKCVLR